MGIGESLGGGESRGTEVRRSAGEGGQAEARRRLSLLLGSVLLNSFQEIAEGDLGGRNALAWIVEGMDVPTDEGIIGPKDSRRFLYESVGALPCVCVVEDVDESIVGEGNSDLYDRVIQNTNVISSNEGRVVTSALYSTGELEGTYVSH